MRRPWLHALLAVSGAGCASDRTPSYRADTAFVPHAVEEYSSEVLMAARGEAAERQHPASRPANRVAAAVAVREPISPQVPPGSRQAAPASLDDVIPVSGTGEVPPAPAVEDGSATPLSSAEAEEGEPASAPLLAGGRPIDLGSALALVAGQNPQVNSARAQVREAYSRLKRAEAMWIPDLQAGASYHRHDGTLQDVGGAIVDVNRNSLNAGFGTGATAAGTVPVPGLVMDFHAADAFFGPEIARRSAWASRHAADVQLNDRLLDVALAYLDLIEAEQRAAILRQTVANAGDLVDVTADFARTGQGLQSDAERAATELRIRRNELARAEEDAAVASARLASLVRLDPTQRLVPIESVSLAIDLVDVGVCGPRDLVAQALGTRPELRQQRALVEEAIQRLKREQYAPLVPSVLVGASYSGFGGGNGDHLGSFHDRGDFDALAVWEVRNLGFGEQAARDEANARIDGARFRQLRAMDEVAREVVEAHTQVTARGPQIATAEEAVLSAQRSYELSEQRIRDGQGLPIEALQAVQALDAARREHLRAVTDYNEAQFRLHRALGWPVHG